jgi:hypothetical protein
MSEFSTTTTFGVIRRLASMGLTSPSLYVLICERGEMEAVQSDLAAEVDVQLGSELRILDTSNVSLDRFFEAIAPNGKPRAVLLTIRQWERKLVDSLDRNVVLLTGAGPLVLLADFEIAERILSAAPNLRNRLADVLLIRPDQSLRRVSI